MSVKLMFDSKRRKKRKATQTTLTRYININLGKVFHVQAFPAINWRNFDDLTFFSDFVTLRY